MDGHRARPQRVPPLDELPLGDPLRHAAAGAGQGTRARAVHREAHPGPLGARPLAESAGAQGHRGAQPADHARAARRSAPARPATTSPTTRWTPGPAWSRSPPPAANRSRTRCSATGIATPEHVRALTEPVASLCKSWSSPSTVPPGPGSPRSRAPSRSGSASRTWTRGRCIAASASPRATATSPPASVAARVEHRARRARVLLDGADVTDGDPHSRASRTWRARSRPTPRCARRSSPSSGRSSPTATGSPKGRDIGTVVAPDAAVKVFLHADPEVRAQPPRVPAGPRRRDVLAEQRVRDERDNTEGRSTLEAPPGSDQVDTTDLTLDEVVDADRCTRREAKETG